MKYPRPSSDMERRPRKALDRRLDSSGAGRHPAERARAEELIEAMSAFLVEQWNGKPSAAQTTFTGWQAKRLMNLGIDLVRLASWRYEISTEQSYSKAKRDAGRDPGDDVGREDTSQ